MGQRLGKGLILAKGLILQPETQNDKGVRRLVELAVEAGDEPVAPQDR
jgi:hypothetical protein